METLENIISMEFTIRPNMKNKVKYVLFKLLKNVYESTNNKEIFRG